MRSMVKGERIAEYNEQVKLGKIDPQPRDPHASKR
jgi:hypothetical protein